MRLLITTLENDPQIVLQERIPPGTITPEGWAYLLCFKGGYPAPPSPLHVKGYVEAFITTSRWVASCPYCNDALPVSKVRPIFWCVKCRMRRNDGHALNVIFPAPQMTREIETILSMRPDTWTRNWKPGETVTFLAKENLAHGFVGFLPPEVAPPPLSRDEFLQLFHGDNH
jgi:hypothetical protein